MTFSDVIREAYQLGLDDEDLDELVHNAASQAASNINNGGLERQVAYLISQWGEADTLQALREAQQQAPHPPLLPQSRIP